MLFDNLNCVPPVYAREKKFEHPKGIASVLNCHCVSLEENTFNSELHLDNKHKKSIARENTYYIFRFVAYC